MDTFLVTTPEQLGVMLRGYRLRRGLSQKALAEKMGLAQKAISIAETRPDRMGVARLFRLLSALRIEVLIQDRRPSRKAHAEDW